MSRGDPAGQHRHRTWLSLPQVMLTALPGPGTVGLREMETQEPGHKATKASGWSLSLLVTSAQHKPKLHGQGLV